MSARSLQTIREHSAILLDGIQKASLQKCPHCQGHFAVVSDKEFFYPVQSALSDMRRPRVFCVKCGRLTCGRTCCDPAIACIPFEAKLENTEGKITSYDDGISFLKERGLYVP